ncbi:RimJ/RimL family protein N-acetyltransferase [Geomicrobium halophilum]|uniref:RimJ/RimL family protein N-acetyltransferase n=1 Tax=Geomicrobium halophilum TaxID=549000 RepID=A0A841Q2S9_9BACL|nr:hypothetical protein [Geomicrobium halophilum]MBB6451368.1 RimJ/RimL family protein N-acetyltransferase [Geomicrobium halophilum]
MFRITHFDYHKVLKGITSGREKKQNGDLLLAIENEDYKLIGYVFLQNIEYEHGRASSIGILLAPKLEAKVLEKM